jgi:phosphomannomutase/phosphoglucomutase
MGVVTEKGIFFAGDKLLAFLSEPVIKAFPGAGVVYDGKCSSGLKELIERWGGTPCISPTGHSFIKQTIAREGALVAGELSCHFFFKDRYFGFDDGIYAALRLCERLHDDTVSLDDFLENFPYRVASPELRIPCSLLQGPVIVQAAHLFFEQQKDVQLSTLDGVRVEKKYGWGMLRASQTESVICMRLESPSQEGLALLKEDFKKALVDFYSLEFLNQAFTW